MPHSKLFTCLDPFEGKSEETLLSSFLLCHFHKGLDTSLIFEACYVCAVAGRGTKVRTGSSSGWEETRAVAPGEAHALCREDP